MKDRFKMTLRENNFVSKKLLAETVYLGLQLEGSKLTFPETQALLAGAKNVDATEYDILVMINMRNALRFIISNTPEVVTLDHISKINYYVAMDESLDWGVLRTGAVGIRGTDYKQTIPNRNNVMRDIGSILTSEMSTTEKAIEYFLYGAKNQLFWDGNKRTSLLAANSIMMAKGCGVFLVKPSDISEFNLLLSSYYTTGEKVYIKEFMYDKCIHGLIFDTCSECGERVTSTGQCTNLNCCKK